MVERKNLTIRLIALSLFMACATVSFSQQKTKFGFSLQGSMGLITNKTRNIDRIFETLHVTKYEGKVSENQKRLWTNSELGFDIYTRNKQWVFSVGLREFKWHYNRDSVTHHYPDRVIIDTQYGPWPVTIQKPYYAFSKRALSTVLPFISSSYILKLSNKTGISCSASIGYLGIFERKAERNFAYNEGLQYNLENNNPNLVKFKYKGKLNLYALDCRLSVDYFIRLNDIFQLSAGLSYYYAQNGIAIHHGVYSNARLSVRFKKNAIN